MKYSVRPEKDVLLCVRYYAAHPDPSRPSKLPVVLVPGLMNSADLFDVPGAVSYSLARRLQRAGHDVYTYDQRGTGDSQIKDWHFGLRENAFIDLPSVIAFALERSQSDSVIIGGYGLGGLFAFLLITHLLKYEGTLRNIEQSHIEKIFAIAAPGILLPRKGRWQHLYSRGLQYAAKRSAVIDRVDFLHMQVHAYDPALCKLLPKMVLRWMLHLAQKNHGAAYLVKKWPFPTLYHPIDFDTGTFLSLLRSQSLHRTSKQLLTEIFKFAQTDGSIKITVPEGCVDLPNDFRLWQDMPLFLFSSYKDALVPFMDVKIVADAVRRARLCLIDDILHPGCGHWGYIFHRPIADYVAAAILQFIKQ